MHAAVAEGLGEGINHHAVQLANPWMEDGSSAADPRGGCCDARSLGGVVPAGPSLRSLTHPANEVLIEQHWGKSSFFTLSQTLCFGFLRRPASCIHAIVSLEGEGVAISPLPIGERVWERG